MVNKERVQALVDALRSGEFPQTTGKLRDETGYCCLGVACEVYRRDLNKGEWDGAAFNIGEIKHTDQYSDNVAEGVLSKMVQEYFGFKSTHPLIKYSGKPIVEFRGRSKIGLAELNDIARLNFNQIADIIEENFLKEVASV
jgi:hypothetical protein